MKTVITLVLLVLLLPSSALAGKIYGIIKKDGRPVGQRIGVWINAESDSAIADNAIASTKTKRNGLYRLYVRGTGMHKLSVLVTLDGRKRFLSTSVRLYRKSVRYNLVIQRVEREQDEQAEYILRRE
jgi:hypothetical protein